MKIALDERLTSRSFLASRSQEETGGEEEARGEEEAGGEEETRWYVSRSGAREMRGIGGEKKNRARDRFTRANELQRRTMMRCPCVCFDERS